MVRSFRVLAALALFGLACSSKEAQQIDEAKKAQAAGDLDKAIADLEFVRTTSHDEAKVAEASALATKWLLEAAAKETAAPARRRQLERALEWSPSSGEVGARLCLALADEEKDADAEKCLGEGMKGKTNAPESILGRAREKIAARKEIADSKQRAELLATGRPAQLQLVIDKWPTSPEAAKAKEKLAHALSLCTDSGIADDLRAELAALEKLAGDELALSKKGTDEARLGGAEKAGKDLQKRAGDLHNKGTDAEAHAAKPGEEKLRLALRDGYWKLSELAGTAGDALRRPDAESEESYSDEATRAFGALAKGLKGARVKIDKDLDAGSAICRGQ